MDDVDSIAQELFIRSVIAAGVKPSQIDVVERHAQAAYGVAEIFVSVREKRRQPAAQKPRTR